VSCLGIPSAFMEDVDGWVHSQVGSVAKKKFVNLQGTLNESCLMAPRPRGRRKN